MTKNPKPRLRQRVLTADRIAGADQVSARPSAFSTDCKAAGLSQHERRVRGADDLAQGGDASTHHAIDSEDRLLTTDEVAEFLSVSKSFVVKARGSGTGPDFIEMGDRVIRYKLSKVKAWRDAREVRRNKGLRKRK